LFLYLSDKIDYGFDAPISLVENVNENLCQNPESPHHLFTMLSKETRKWGRQQEKPKQTDTNLASKTAPGILAIFEEEHSKRVAHSDYRIQQTKNDSGQVGSMALIVYRVVVARSTLDKYDDRHEQLETL